MSKNNFDEARERSSRVAQRRRIRLFIIGVAIGAVCAAIAKLAIIAALQREAPAADAWTAAGDGLPQRYEEVLVARSNGEWASAYLDDNGEFVSNCDGLRVKGAVRWARVNSRP